MPKLNGDDKPEISLTFATRALTFLRRDNESCVMRRGIVDKGNRVAARRDGDPEFRKNKVDARGTTTDWLGVYTR